MFDDRLTKLREEMGLSRKEAATKLNMPYTTYLNYENNEREPNSETLIQIADFFNVSIDYLLGISPVKTTNIDIQQIHAGTGLTEKAIENIRNFCTNEMFGMVWLNRLLEDLTIPYVPKKSILYEIILYLFLVNEHHVKYGSCFVLTTNNRIERIGNNKQRTPSEITRISENEIIEQIMLNRILDTLRTKTGYKNLSEQENELTNIKNNNTNIQTPKQEESEPIDIMKDLDEYLQSRSQIAAQGGGVSTKTDTTDYETMKKLYDELDD